MSHSHINEHSTGAGGASHGSLKSYLIGFILSVVLTVIPFVIVMNGTASHATILFTIVAMAVVQILVHLVCFLHMNTSSEQRWNLAALVFSAIIIAILVVGSLWIMHNLNLNMMVD